jgi:hypothetical protein
MPWGVLGGGCAVSLIITEIGHLSAEHHGPPSMTMVIARVSLLVLVMGTPFLVADPQRVLAGTLPVRAWLLTVIRVALALPPAALAVAVAVKGTDAALRLELGHGAGPVAGQVPLLLTLETLAAAVIALSLGCAAARTRWADLGGVIAVAGTLAILAALALGDPALFPLPPGPASGAAADYAAACRPANLACGVIIGVVLGAACYASRDPWHRLPARFRSLGGRRGREAATEAGPWLQSGGNMPASG